ncbi:MAG: DsbA family protein [Siculibacillus sp.]|nr:DsbA family protein [Siculibacillus sp.]
MTDTPPPIDAADDVDVLAPGTLIVLVDPLCGWCWGAAPALTRLAAAGERLEVVASGLFIGGRDLTPDFAAYAWENDRRIAAMTGQVFSETYREKVLGVSDGRIDSGPATLALTAVQMRTPEKGLDTLHALQAARWVDGLDITAESVVAEVLRRAGIDEDTVALFLAEDEAVIDALNQRAGFSRDLMSRLGARGVPTLVRVTETGAEHIDGRVLFEDVESVVARVKAG